jgi:hypothetical protein
MTDHLEDIKLELLMLDDQNPRLPKPLRGKNEKAIIEYMLMEASTLDLMLAIGQNGFFSGEPLLVVKEGEKYRVIEGNRRLTALKLLKDPALAPVQTRRVSQIMQSVTYKEDQIERVPCQVFKDAAPIHKYLGYRHITGVQSWDLTQKASFLTDIRLSEFPSLNVDDASRELAKMIGSRGDYVKRLLIGYSVFETIRDNAYFKVRGLNEESFYFNYIADSLRQPAITEFLGVDMEKVNPIDNLDQSKLKLWTEWFFEKNEQNKTRIKATAEELKMLNAVLKDERAFLAFSEEKKPLEVAYELTGAIEDVFQSSIVGAISSLEIADSLTHRLPKVYGRLSEDLSTLRRLINKVRKATEEGLDDDA